VLGLRGLLLRELEVVNQSYLTVNGRAEYTSLTKCARFDLHSHLRRTALTLCEWPRFPLEDFVAADFDVGHLLNKGFETRSKKDPPLQSP
jgi:hypothetical protein